jgi:hypothetical protein
MHDYATSSRISTNRPGMSTMTSWPDGTSYVFQPGIVFSFANV